MRINTSSTAALATAFAVSLATLTPSASFAQGAASSWQGPYIGAAVGAGFDKSNGVNWSEADALTVGFGWPSCYGPGSCPHSLPGNSNTSLVAGMQAGYNVMFSRLLAGIEVDFSGRVGTGTTVLAPQVSGPGSYVEQIYSQRANWTSTVRGRLGGLLTPTLLVYGTGGFAFGEIERSYTSNVYSGGTYSFGSAGSRTSTETGWVAGAGAEWAVLSNVTLGIEYLHLDLGDNSTFSSRGNFGVCLFGGCSFNVNAGGFTEDSVRVKVNFKL